jgi:t-SNARE complex subunit (syntaxin)
MQKKSLLRTKNLLDKGNNSLARSLRILDENEELGISMSEKLGHQKEIIKNSIKKIEDTDINLDEADGILYRIDRREKYMLYIILILIIVDIILFLSVIYVLLVKKLKIINH